MGPDRPPHWRRPFPLGKAVRGAFALRTVHPHGLAMQVPMSVRLALYTAAALTLVNVAAPMPPWAWVMLNACAGGVIFAGAMGENARGLHLGVHLGRHHALNVRVVTRCPDKECRRIIIVAREDQLGPAVVLHQESEQCQGKNT